MHPARRCHSSWRCLADVFGISRGCFVFIHSTSKWSEVLRLESPHQDIHCAANTFHHVSMHIVGSPICTQADLYIRILYTCSVQDELDHQTALHALDLAHRWQVDVVVAILTDLLAGAQAALH